MHVIKLKWWWWMSCLLILLKRIDTLDFNDLGLPNQSNCAFASNKTLYIIGEIRNVSITFDNDDIHVNPPKIISQQRNQQISRQFNTTNPACIITRSGKVILVPNEQQEGIQIIQNISPNLTVVTETNMTFDGSQAAIDKFITRSTFLTNYTLTSFNNYVLIQGGQDINQTESQNTYILDLRYPALGVWYELEITSFTPPPSSFSNSALYATSRWILHFRTEFRQDIYITFVDCFDPFTFLWLGTITSFNTTTNSIKAIPLSTSTVTSDSLIIIPSWSSPPSPPSSPSFATQGFNHSETATNNHIKQTTFWKLDISKWIFNNITITPIIINNVNSKTNQQKRDENQTSLFFNPILGGTVTLIAADLAVFYGGTIAISSSAIATTDQQESMLFFNTTSFKFLPQPSWLSNNNATIQQENTFINNNQLAIILGSVMGSVLFIALLILFVWCCIKRKRSRDGLRHEQQHQTKNSLLLSKTSKGTRLNYLHNNAINKFSHIKKSNCIESHNIGNPPNMAEASSEQTYVLSPIQCLSPIDLFPNIAAAAVVKDEKDIKPPLPPPLTSRFIEHFDYNSFPLVKNNATNNNDSLGNMAPSSSLQLKIATKTKTETTEDGSSEK